MKCIASTIPSNEYHIDSPWEIRHELLSRRFSILTHCKPCFRLRSHVVTAKFENDRKSYSNELIA